MKFDAPMLAHAWLAVAQAASTHKDDHPAIFKAVTIEEYPTGARLVATDRFVLLTAWVPYLSDLDAAEPHPDEIGNRMVVASDPDGRARGLCGYVLSLAGRLDSDGGYVPGMLELTVDFDVLLPEGDAPGFEGMEPTYTVLSLPDTESVYLRIVDLEVSPASAGWRNVVTAHKPALTKTIGLNTEFLERIGRVRKHAEGTLMWSFGGSDHAALIDWPDSEPHVSGAIMPRHVEDEDESADTEAAAS